MNFENLQTRLLERLRGLVRNGQYSERALAMAIGLSQPHMHNVLKGARMLTLDVADQILDRLEISVLDLCEPEELADHIRRAQDAAALSRSVPVLAGAIGEGFQRDMLRPGSERIAVPTRFLTGFMEPVALRAGHDPAMEPFLEAGDWLLADLAEVGIDDLDPASMYAVETGHGIRARWVRHGGTCLYAIDYHGRNHPAAWNRIPISEENISEIVLARLAIFERNA